MIRRITLDNFMSHVHTEIELAGGLTALVGPNNCGKSAIVVALQAVCGNTETDFMVRHGAKEATVTIETDDGHSIIWRRKRKYASYCLDGTWNHRPSADYLQKVHALLRLPPVRSADGSDAFEVHLGLQKSPIFLLNESKLKQAAFFASSSDAEKLLEMQRRHRANVTDDRRALSRAREELAKVDGRLATLTPLEAMAAIEEQLQTQAGEHVASTAAISQLQRSAASLAAVRQNKDSHARTVDALMPLHPAPAMTDPSSLDRLVGQIDSFESQRRSAAARGEALRALRVPPPVFDIAPLEKAIERITASAAGVRRALAMDATLSRVADVPPLADEATLARVISQMRRSAHAARGALDRQREAGSLRPLINLADVTALQGAANAVRQAMILLEKARAAASAAQRAAAAAREKIVDWAHAHPICPVCDAPVDADRLLAGGHAHG